MQIDKAEFSVPRNSATIDRSIPHRFRNRRGRSGGTGFDLRSEGAKTGMPLHSGSLHKLHHPAIPCILTSPLPRHIILRKFWACLPSLSLGTKFPEGETMKLRIACVVIGLLPLVSLAVAQTSPQAASALPRLVRFGGTLKDLNGNPLTGVVGITFAFYSEKTGGAPLWLETQNAAADDTGHYAVLLGSTKPEGLPADLFISEQARWVGVQVSGQPEQPRVLLVSAPYALKSGDAETLGGLPASAFVLAAPPVGAVNPASTGGATSNMVTPDTAITGTGTAGYLPDFTGAATIGNSAVFQSGTSPTAKIGINTNAPTAGLDVHGSAAVRGTLTMPTTGNATAAVGKNSQPLDFIGSSFNSGTSAPVAQTFQLKAEPVGNDTASPSASLNLLYGAGTSAPGETGLAISSKGLFTFAAGQTFPGTGTLKGITTAAGSGLSGGGTTGTLSLGLKACAANQILKYSGTAWNCAAASGSGTITGVTAGTDLTGGGTTGNVTLNLDTTKVPQLGASNTFTAGQTINGASSVSGSVFGPVLSVSNSDGASSATAITASNSGQYGIGISATAASDGWGIEGFGTQTAGSIGVLGSLANSSGFSNSFFLLESDDGLDSGVWADGPNGQESALIATSDDLSAGIFFNDSSASSTILVLNNYSGGPTGNVATGFGTVLRAEGPRGVCGINQAGTIACTGQVKTLATTRNGARQVETYSVQSAENWLEDYGSGQLRNGGVIVNLDPTFAETVNTGVDFHVFLTPGGDCKGLYVTNKTASSFEVHELGGGTASIPFDYKIVAKRRGHETERLVDVTDRMQMEGNAAHFTPLAKSLPRRTMTHNGVAASNAKIGNTSTRQLAGPHTVPTTPAVSRPPL
jgi:hypothetical protein